MTSPKRTPLQDYAFTCGELAHFAQLQMTDCPYPDGHDLAHWWRMGYEHSQRLMEQSRAFREWERENGL